MCMQVEAIQKSYRRWAPVYDLTFGRITQGGRALAAAHVNAQGGTVLEVGSAPASRWISTASMSA